MRRVIQRFRRYPATIGLLIVWLCVQLFIESGGGWRHQGDFLQHWGFAAHDWASWQRGTWVTYAFLHVNWWHWGLNLLVWTRLAYKIEWMLGSLWVLRVTWLCVIAAALTHALLGFSSDAALIGASGATMGILVFVAVIDPDALVLRGVRLRMRSLAMGLMATEMIFLILQLALLLESGGTQARTDLPVPFGAVEMLQRWVASSWLIGHACHLGGGVMGWALAHWVMRPRVNLRDLQRMRVKNSHQRS